MLYESGDLSLRSQEPGASIDGRYCQSERHQRLARRNDCSCARTIPNSAQAAARQAAAGPVPSAHQAAPPSLVAQGWVGIDAQRRPEAMSPLNAGTGGQTRTSVRGVPAQMLAAGVEQPSAGEAVYRALRRD